MQGILLRTLIAILGLFLASKVVPGVVIQGTGTFILAGLLMGLVNGIVRPIAIVLTLPLTILTLGLFLLVLNAGMFGLVAAFLDNFSVAGFLVRAVRCHYCQRYDHRVFLVHRSEGQVRGLCRPSALAGESTFTGSPP